SRRCRDGHADKTRRRRPSRADRADRELRRHRPERGRPQRAGSAVDARTAGRGDGRASDRAVTDGHPALAAHGCPGAVPGRPRRAGLAAGTGKRPDLRRRPADAPAARAAATAGRPAPNLTTGGSMARATRQRRPRPAGAAAPGRPLPVYPSGAAADRPATPEGVAPAAWLALTLATLAFTICFSVWGILSPLAPFFREQYALAGAQVGFLVAVPVVLGSLVRIPLG